MIQRNTLREIAAVILLWTFGVSFAFAELDVQEDCGATGDGTTNDAPVIAACIASGDQNTVYFPKGVYRLSSRVIFRRPLQLKFDAGAKLVADPGVFIDVNCPVDASPHLHFDGDGNYRFRAPDHRVLRADWFPTLQRAIDAVPHSQPSSGGGGDAHIKLSAKTYFGNIVIGSATQTKDIRLSGAVQYHTAIQGGSTGPALTVINSRVHLEDFYACNTPGSGFDAISLRSEGVPGDGLGGAKLDRIGVCSAGRDGLFIEGGVRFWLNDLTIYGTTRHAITLGTERTRVSEISIDNLSVRGVRDGMYGLNLVNAAILRATGRIEETTSLVNLEGAGSYIYLDLFGESRDYEGYRQ